MFAALASRRPLPALRHPELWIAGALALFTLLVRGAWLGDANADGDEQLYSLIGSAMLEGAVPYVDLWDRKPWGLFALFALAHALFGPGPEAYQLLAALFTIAGAWLTYVLAGRQADRSTALAAGFLYVVLTAIYGAYSGNSEAFFLPMMLAMAVLVRDPDRADAVPRALAAMLIGGLALQVKYTVLPQCLFFGLWVLWGRHVRGMPPARLALLAAACGALGLLPTVLVGAAYAWAGHGDAFVFANFLSFFDRLPASAGRLHSQILLFLVPLAGLALLGLNAARRAGPAEIRALAFVALWLLAAAATVFLPSTVYRYYLAALVPPAVLLGLPLFTPRPGTRINIPALVPAALYLALMPFQYAMTQDNRAAIERLAAAIAPRVDDESRCLFVFDGPPALYRMSASCLPTRYPYPDHLNNVLERKALGVRQEDEVARILAARPPVIVTANRPATPQNRAATRLVEQAIARDYREIAREPLGPRDFHVWALRR